MCTYSLSSPGEKGVVFLRKDRHFIARLRCALKCETILILIQGTSSSLELTMGSWVLRLVDVFPSAAPRNTSTGGRVGETLLLTDITLSRQLRTSTIWRLHNLDASAGAIICFIEPMFHQANGLLHQHYALY